MPGLAPESRATLSVLDRLIDDDPGNNWETPMTPSESVRAVRDSLRRDLEWLLNARRIAVEPPKSLTELQRSVYVFGLPDLASFALASDKERKRLLQALKTAVKIFEPRLTQVQVIPTEHSETHRSKVSFRIEALLRMDPAPERISFDTVLELSTGAYSIKGGPDAG